LIDSIHDQPCQRDIPEILSDALRNPKRRAIGSDAPRRRDRAEGTCAAT
jgi:hypothetical protein